MMNYRKLLSLSQNRHVDLHLSHVGWLALAAMPLLMGVATAFAVAPGNPAIDVDVVSVTENLALPAYTLPAENHERYWRAETIQRGDTLARAMHRAGVRDSEAMRFIRQSPLSRDMLRLPVGATLHIETNDAGEMLAIRYLQDDQNGEKRLLSIKQHNGEWQANADAVEADAIATPRILQVRSTFAAAARQARIPGDIRTQLAEMFSDEFDLDALRPNDSVSLIYETLYYEGETIGTGRILAAEVERAGKKIQAYYYAHDEESGSYYYADGRPLKKGFDIRPVDNARISSGFGTRRHPVLGGLRMHEGIDYAAPSGTPIRASADGVVARAGGESGYGNVVKIRHKGRYETVYAHMSRFAPGLHAGSPVKAGDVIGFVGSTGRSTGPHLHFELHVDGTPVDPAVNALPAPRLSAVALRSFQHDNVALAKQLKVLDSTPVAIAQAE